MHHSIIMSPILYAGLQKWDQKAIKSMTRGNIADTILEASSKALDVSIELIKSPLRKRNVTDARSIAIGLILHHCPDFGVKRLGRILNRDHSTIIASRDVFNELYERDKIYTDKVELVLKKL